MSGQNGLALLDVRTARAALAAARGEEKLDLLLSAPDPLRLVQSIPPGELYLAVLDVGIEEAREIIALASPEQFVHFVDLSCWPGRGLSGPDPQRVLRWLMLARATESDSDASLARYRKKLARLDPELLSLTLRRELIVQIAGGAGSGAAESGVDLPDSGGPLSGRVHLGRRDVPDDEGAARRPLRAGPVRDHAHARVAALGAAHRAGRERAALAHGAPARLRRARPGRGALVLCAAGEEEGRGRGAPRRRHSSSTDRADPRRTRRPRCSSAPSHVSPATILAYAEEGLLYAANASVVASGAELDDAKALRAAVEDARAGLSLGLDLLSSGDEAWAAELLAQTPVREIFQAAMGEAYRLQSRARAVQKLSRLPLAQAVTLLDAPLSTLVDALSAVRPENPGRARPRQAARAREQTRRRSSRGDARRGRGDRAAARGVGNRSGRARPRRRGRGRRAVGAARKRCAPPARRDAVARRALRAARGPHAAGPRSEGFEGRLDDLLQDGTKAVHSAPAARAASRLRAQILESKKS